MCGKCSSTECLTCEEGAFLESGKCKNCSNGCRSCIDGKSCTSCAAGFGRRYSHPKPTLCYKCPSGQYLDGKECKPCGIKCRECSDKDTCLKCSEPYNLDKHGLCITCRKSTFYDKTSKKCHNCPWNCQKCTSQNTCDLCVKGYSLNLHSSSTELCLKIDCPTGYYQDGVTCKQCGKGCDSCNVIKCLSCSKGTFYQEKTNSCQKCPDHCASCKNLTSCTECA